MLTDSQKRKILDIAIERGFEGCVKNRAYFQGSSMTISQVVRHLHFEEVFMKSEDLELKVLCVNFKETREHISSLLFENKKIEEFKLEYSQEFNNIADSSKDLENKLMDNLDVFTTPKLEGMDRYRSKSPRAEGVVLFSAKTRRFLPASYIDPGFILKKRGIGKEDIDKIPCIWPVFNPYSTELFVTTFLPEVGSEIRAVNTYAPPQWRFVRSQPKYHGIIKKLIDNVIPLPEEREYVLDWLRQSIVGRNETVLVLVGDRGVGKTLLSKLFFSLVGEEYSAIAKRETLTEKFNNVLYMARAVAFEETGMEGDEESIERMKAFCNTKLSIEFKGENAFTANNYASMIMSLNGNSRLGVKPQERRFSIPRIGNLNFNKVVEEEEIIEFSKELDAEIKSETFLKYLSEFGEYLLARTPTTSVSKPLRGSAYYEITSQSLTEWESTIINYIIENGEYDTPIFLKDVKRSMGGKERRSMFPTRDAKISTFLQDYRHLDEFKIGTLTRRESDGKHENVQSIVPNNAFLKKYGLKYRDKEEDLL